jgi:hypothetical protein
VVAVEGCVFSTLRMPPMAGSCILAMLLPQ